ncbi:hypothetical protein PUN28_011033 [Cardiocondyla obscurior]|uniref:Uncharacterized protein n=1 Tax=Cardiocondyla obscurior TaxID=286306 RepID=A0AAW2FPR1_9HYME
MSVNSGISGAAFCMLGQIAKFDSHSRGAAGPKTWRVFNFNIRSVHHLFDRNRIT